MDTEALFEWFFLLEAFDYYELLRIPRSADYDAIKQAFHVFAETFHPDAQVSRSADERLALDAIFKRGTEAYAVLTDPRLRAEYDAQFAPGPPTSAPHRSPSVAPPPTRHSSIPAAPPLPSDRVTLPPGMSASASGRPGRRARLSDGVATASARPHAKRAEELLEDGELALAKEQLSLASKMEPENDLLRAYLHHIEGELKK